MLSKLLAVVLTILVSASALAATAQVNSIVNMLDHNGGSMLSVPESQEHGGTGAGASTYIVELAAVSDSSYTANQVLAFVNVNDFNTGTGSSPSNFKVPSTSTFQVSYVCEGTQNGAGWWSIGVTPSSFTNQASTTLPSNSACIGKQGSSCGYYVPSAGSNAYKCYSRHFRVGPNMSPFAQFSIGASNNAVGMILGGVLK